VESEDVQGRKKAEASECGQTGPVDSHS
jgi:hypothetical protein